MFLSLFKGDFVHKRLWRLHDYNVVYTKTSKTLESSRDIAPVRIHILNELYRVVFYTRK